MLYRVSCIRLRKRATGPNQQAERSKSEYRRLTAGSIGKTPCAPRNIGNHKYESVFGAEAVEGDGEPFEEKMARLGASPLARSYSNLDDFRGSGQSLTRSSPAPSWPY